MPSSRVDLGRKKKSLIPGIIGANRSDLSKSNWLGLNQKQKVFVHPQFHPWPYQNNTSLMTPKGIPSHSDRPDSALPLKSKWKALDDHFPFSLAGLIHRCAGLGDNWFILHSGVLWVWCEHRTVTLQSNVSFILHFVTLCSDQPPPYVNASSIFQTLSLNWLLNANICLLRMSTAATYLKIKLNLSGLTIEK